MKDVYCFALAADGQRLAVGDGPELLVYRGDGEPLYKHFCDGILLGVELVGENLATLDSEGRVVFFRAADGLKREEVQLDGTPLATFSSPDGAFGVVTSGGPVVVEPTGQFGGYPIQDLAVAAFGPDRTSMGLGTTNGLFMALDATNGAAWGTVDVEGTIRSIAWNHRGWWVVLTDTALLRIDGGGSEIQGRIALMEPGRQVTLSADGALAAVLLDGGRVLLVELHTDQLVGHVVFRRAVHGIRFGRAAQLGFGLDDGDASTVDLITRVTVRTEPHPGRGRNNWNLDMDFDGGPIRAAVTLVRSGGVGPELQLPPDEMEGGGGGCWGVGCMMMNILILACSGCLGIAFLLKYMEGL